MAFDYLITNEICPCVCLSGPVSREPFDLGSWYFVCVIYTWYGRFLRKKNYKKSKKKFLKFFSRFFKNFFLHFFFQKKKGDRREPKGEFFTILDYFVPFCQFGKFWYFWCKMYFFSILSFFFLFFLFFLFFSFFLFSFSFFLKHFLSFFWQSNESKNAAFFSWNVMTSKGIFFSWNYLVSKKDPKIIDTFFSGNSGSFPTQYFTQWWPGYR